MAEFNDLIIQYLLIFLQLKYKITFKKQLRALVETETF